MSGGGGPDTAHIAQQASLMQSQPVNGALMGGRVFGLLGDVQGIIPGGGATQGLMGKQILNGGLFGMNNSGQKAPGILAQMGLSFGAIRDDLTSKISPKNDPGAAAITGANNAQHGGGGPDFGAMLASAGPVNIGRGGEHYDAGTPVTPSAGGGMGGGLEIG